MFKKKNKVVVDIHTPQQNLDWSPYVEGQFITKVEKSLLEDLQNNEEHTVKLIGDSVKEYVSLFQKMLRGIHQVHVVKFILDKVRFMFSESEDFLTEFCNHGHAYESLLKNIYRENIEMLSGCYQCISVVYQQQIIKDDKHQIHELIESFVLNLEKFQDHEEMLSVIIKCIMTILKKKTYRRQVYSSGIVKPLKFILNKNLANIQISYEVSLCFWYFSYNEAITKLLYSDELLVALLHHLLKTHSKEKVKRVVLLIFKNIVKYSAQMKILISLGIFKTLQNLLKKNYEDSDIKELLEELIDTIDTHIEEISSFSEYRQEVLLGKLEWSPVHKSEKFWKENTKNFEANSFSIIKKLVELLDVKRLGSDDEEEEEEEEERETETAKEQKVGTVITKKTVVKRDDVDTRTLVIALFDLGQFLVFYPRAKKILLRFEAKNKILRLMAHKNEEVKEMALKTTQKMMVSKWEFL